MNKDCWHFISRIPGEYQSPGRRKEPDMNATKFSVRQDARFECAAYRKLGAYHIMEGDALRAVSNGMGMFTLYASWGDGPLGVYSAETVNELAGREVVQ
jgi:hypothetical protein